MRDEFRRQVTARGSVRVRSFIHSFRLGFVSSSREEIQRDRRYGARFDVGVRPRVSFALSLRQPRGF